MKQVLLKGKSVLIKPILKDGEDISAIWNNKWEVLSRSDNSKVGELHFEGPADKGHIKLNINVKDEAQREEAIKTITRWTVKVSKIYFIEVKVDEKDEVTQAMLSRNSYRFDSIVGDKKVYVAKKEYTSWVIIFICLFGAIGMIVGTRLGHMAAGFGIGALGGAGVGLFLDWLYMRHRKKILGE